MQVRTVIALSLMLVALPIVLLGQTPYPGGTVHGAVTDGGGSALQGASMTVTNPDRGASRSTTTDDRGYYSLPGLYPGTYSLTARATGFRTAKREGVELQMGQSVRIDFAMEVGSADDEVIVSGAAPLVDTTQTAVSTILTAGQLNTLPLSGQNFLSLSGITPGVATDSTLPPTMSSMSGLSFAGQRTSSNNFVMDGFDNNDSTVGSMSMMLSQEAIQGFQVLANSYSAEFGKATGAVVNVTTKSGTNELQGSAFWYFRDHRLKAKDHFEKFDVFGNRLDRGKAPLKQHQFGGTVGGPIWKDTTFFFLSFERLDSHSNNFVTISDTDASVLSAAGFPVQPGANPFDLDQTLLFGRLDHHWSNHSLILRANYSETLNENIEPFGGLVTRSRGAQQDRKESAFAVADTLVFSTRGINEARLQYGRQDQNFNSLDPNCGGPCLRNDEGGPTLEVVGAASVGRLRSTPQPRVTDRIQVTDTLSLFLGRHHVKLGFDFNWHYTHNHALPLHFGGRYLFAPLPAIPGLLPTPITAIQAVELGLPTAYVQGYGLDAIAYKDWDLSAFVQNDWRLSSKLRLKLGMRYQKQSWPRVLYDVSNVNGTRLRYAFPQDNNNIAPRLAIAFDPTSNGKTSLHAAYGIFFDNHVTSIAGITDAIDGSANGVRTLVARYPSPLLLAAWRAPGHRLSEAQAVDLLDGSYPSLVISIDPGLRTPYAHHVTAGFDRELGKDFALSADVVYVRGKHQLGTIDYNPVLPSILGPGRRPNDLDGRVGTSASVLQYTSFGETWYKGLTVSLRKRFSKRYQFVASYTLSKAEENSADFQSNFMPQDNGAGRNAQDPTALPVGFDATLERGPATHDQRHRFRLSGLYQLPWQIQLSTIITAASGRPFTPIAGADLNGDGDGDAFPGPDRARRNPADISTSVARNSENLPKQFVMDLRLSKRVKLGRRGRVELIVDTFNLFNRTNYVDVNNVFGTGMFPDEPLRDRQGRVTFGTFTAALPPRQIQLAAKLSF